MSTISIIGLGGMAGAIAGRALAGGDAVELIGRDSAKAKAVAAALDGATVGAAGATPAGDLVILAVPYGSAAAVVSEYRDALRDKVIIDITNPVNAELTAAAEEVPALPSGDEHQGTLRVRQRGSTP